jgi:hypothetical protein
MTKRNVNKTEPLAIEYKEPEIIKKVEERKNEIVSFEKEPTPIEYKPRRSK